MANGSISLSTRRTVRADLSDNEEGMIRAADGHVHLDPEVVDGNPSVSETQLVANEIGFRRRNATLR